jgi:very-short-patch-repair endonuclease
MSSSVIGVEKTKQLFRFLREISRQRSTPVRMLKDEIWHLDVETLPVDTEYLRVCFRDDIEPDEDWGVSHGPLLYVKNPPLSNCPAPDDILLRWLRSGWENPNNEPSFLEEIESASAGRSLVTSDGDKATVEFFSDDPRRVSARDKWLRVRRGWANRQNHLQSIKDLFDVLYAKRADLARESETIELMVGTGYITDSLRSIDHPILSRRVRIKFDEDENVITIDDVDDARSEINGSLLSTMPDVEEDAVGIAEKDVASSDYHPMDRTETPHFLRRVANIINSSCTFSEGCERPTFNRGSILSVYMRHSFYIRRVPDGVERAVSSILDAIDAGVEIPEHLQRIVCGGEVSIPEHLDKTPIEERLAEVGGESNEILLTRQANREQLEIAKRINDYDAALVQGPPGTGKTYTIANLMGSFLSEGKSVLVTSYKKKALSVVKEKMEPELRGLCVSRVDDTQADMIRSVTDINERMARKTARGYLKDSRKDEQERKAVITSLADVRRKIFASLGDEYKPIRYGNETYSPVEAARYVHDNAEIGSLVPGDVKEVDDFPLSDAELSALYVTNGDISPEEEAEIDSGIPGQDACLDADAFQRICSTTAERINELGALAETHGWSLASDGEGFPHGTVIDGAYVAFPVGKKDLAGTVLKALEPLGTLQKWQINAIVDGKDGGAHLKRWIRLKEIVIETNEKSESCLTLLDGREITLPDADIKTVRDTVDLASEPLEVRGSISKLWKLTHRQFSGDVFDAILIDNRPISDLSDCGLLTSYLDLLQSRKECARVWDELMAGDEVPSFFDLDDREPERVAMNALESIDSALRWDADQGSRILSALSELGLPLDKFYRASQFASESSLFVDKLRVLVNTLQPILSMTLALADALDDMVPVNKSVSAFEAYADTPTCRSAALALRRMNPGEYRKCYERIVRLAALTETRSMRANLLHRLRESAPGLAQSIERRDGAHGLPVVPSRLKDAWRWKQLSAHLDAISSTDISSLEHEVVDLERRYRRVTKKLACDKAWAALLERTERDVSMRQALTGWMQTERKIGKGTGKRAASLRATARRQMVECQRAVPAWIMTINDALTTLDPAKNRFDVVIIDEASQANITALAVLFMAKKVIVVGDDKQVSPMGIGLDINQTNKLIATYLRAEVPNAQLYTQDTSLYDIAMTTFKPLMLREHFRCVPDIIGFSNVLSYDGKIKPLRDAGSTRILPAVVNRRVDGERSKEGKTNLREAREIVCLMRACMDQPEYHGKSFGAITLLGDEQAELIRRLAYGCIPLKDLEKHNFLCGNSADFQGDERDVIWLSMVDSGEVGHPLSLATEGNQDSRKKRYNVAASRAKDQLWVVNSLDPSCDLKEGDLRKKLLQYADDPKAFGDPARLTEDYEFSGLEELVALGLRKRGYSVTCRWEVGSYVLGIVVTSGNKRVAVECDGDRVVNGTDWIENDMERQAVLERVGWQFIRVRSSEYYRDPEGFMDRLVISLREREVEPLGNAVSGMAGEDLLGRVNDASARYMEEFFGTGDITSETPHPTSTRAEEQFLGQRQKSREMPANIAEEFKNLGFDIVDQRGHGARGTLWILGGKEDGSIINEVANLYQQQFVYRAHGTKSTGGKPAWKLE